MNQEPSKQVKWQRKQRSEGNCRQCGKPSEHSSCRECTIKWRISQREKKGFKAHKEGSRGRPPMYAE